MTPKEWYILSLDETSYINIDYDRYKKIYEDFSTKHNIKPHNINCELPKETADAMAHVKSLMFDKESK